MPEHERDQEILQILAERLPEKVLLELLPGVEPGAVRQLLAHFAAEAPSADNPRKQTFSSRSHSS